MAKRKNKDEDQMIVEISDVLGIIKESDSTDWCKIIAYFDWLTDKKKGDKRTLDIRNYNFNNKKIGKGISLSNEDVDILTNILLENDFGSLEELEKAIKRRRDFFSVSDTIGDTLLFDDTYTIDVK